MMFGKFNGEYINFNAVSEIFVQKQDDAYKIIVLRLDGAYMASETYDNEEDATRAYENLWSWLMDAGIASTMR